MYNHYVVTYLLQLITWYLLVELKGISHTLGYCVRHFSTDITRFSKYLSKADSEASPIVSLYYVPEDTPYYYCVTHMSIGSTFSWSLTNTAQLHRHATLVNARHASDASN